MSKNFNQSDYGKNRYSKGIVFSTADRDLVLTKEQFLESDPALTEADFDHWKTWSDKNYTAEDRARTLESKHILAIEQFEVTELVSENTVEEIALERLEPHKNPYTIENAMNLLDKHLTVTQKRRYLMLIRDDLTIREIAQIEGVGFTKIQKSIDQAKNKLKKFL